MRPVNAAAPHEITQLLADWNNGRQEALADLLPVVYGELRRAAARCLRRERARRIRSSIAFVRIRGIPTCSVAPARHDQQLRRRPSDLFDHPKRGARSVEPPEAWRLIYARLPGGAAKALTASMGAQIVHASWCQGLLVFGAVACTARAAPLDSAETDRPLAASMGRSRRPLAVRECHKDEREEPRTACHPGAPHATPPPIEPFAAGGEDSSAGTSSERANEARAGEASPRVCRRPSSLSDVRSREEWGHTVTAAIRPRRGAGDLGRPQRARCVAARSGTADRVDKSGTIRGGSTRSRLSPGAATR